MCKMCVRAHVLVPMLVAYACVRSVIKTPCSFEIGFSCVCVCVCVCVLVRSVLVLVLACACVCTFVSGRVMPVC